MRVKPYDIALIAVMSTMLEVSKIALNAIPNLELVSFLLIVFTLHFGFKRAMCASYIFVAIEIMTWGMNIWMAFYLYVWAILVIVIHLLRRYKSVLLFSVVSGVYGFSFGALSALIYVAVGDFGLALSWWISGLSFDLIHGVSNFCIMLVLYKPIMYALEKIDPERV